MKIKFKFKVILVMISLSVSLCLMSNTYSRYVASGTSNVEATFANWQILVNENDIASNNSSSISLTPIINPNENVKEHTLAPTSEGYFDIDIDSTNVDVSFSYSIDLEVINEDIPDILIGKYSIIDESYDGNSTLTEYNIVDNNISNTLLFDNDTTDFSFEPFTIRVYFEWYDGIDNESGNAGDSAIGNDAANNNTMFNIDATINFTQYLG